MSRLRNKTRRAAVYISYAVGLAFIQTTLPDSLALFGAKPDLTLVLVILAGYLYGIEDGIFIGLTAGFMRDMLAGRSLGLGMLLLMYAAILAWTLFRGHFRRNVFMGLVQVLLISLFYHLLIAALAWVLPMLADQVPDLGRILSRTLLALPGQLLANGLAALPLVLMLRYFGPYDRNINQDEMEDTLTGEGTWRMN